MSQGTEPQLLPQPGVVALVGAIAHPFDIDAVRLKGDFADYWTYPIPASAIQDLRVPFLVYLYRNGLIEHTYIVTDYKTQPGTEGIETPWPEITDPKDVGRKHELDNPNKIFKTWFRCTNPKKLDIPISLTGLKALYGFQNTPAALRAAFIPVEDILATTHNWLFASVRPDWRDSKSLLGYYNPLTKTYAWTDFLRFIQQAVRSYRSGDGLAWFFILDEMNLARVEYYFADLLSVLESGRDDDGWTREPLRLEYPDDAEGDLPPREIYLSPNLYILGTVNVDETTHAFSPKVLDRAFTLELTEVSFVGYPTQPIGQPEGPSAKDRARMLEAFTNNGAFVHIKKQAIADYLSENSAYRDRLQKLNDLLRPHDLHFGYRAFDEIIAFMENAARTGLYKGIGGPGGAFDAAVLMKVLPKFHGSRGKLEEPLKALLAWCINPLEPDTAQIDQALQNASSTTLLGELETLTYRYPHTAARAQRMLRSLYTSGFAAFG